MRSEKEIKGILKQLKTKKALRKFEKEGHEELETLMRVPIESVYATGMIGGMQGAIEAILEGEPRYSVAELEKIIDYWDCCKDIREFIDVDSLIELLKDKKKVQEILND